MSEVVWHKECVDRMPAVHHHALHSVWDLDVQDWLAAASFELTCHECGATSLDWFELPVDEMYEACRAFCRWYKDARRRSRPDHRESPGTTP